MFIWCGLSRFIRVCYGLLGWFCEEGWKAIYCGWEGGKVAVIIPIDEFEELLEDLHDLAVMAERRDEPTVSFEEVKKRLKNNDDTHGIF